MFRITNVKDYQQTMDSQKAGNAEGAKLVSAEFLGRRYGIATKTVRKWGWAGFFPWVKFSARCIRYPLVECDQVMERRHVRCRGNG